MDKTSGRVTLPVEEGCFEQVKALAARFGADALRDSDGTAFSSEYAALGLRRYATYFVSRGHNAFAASHPKEQQRVCLMSRRVLCTENTVRIPLIDGYFDKQIRPDADGEIRRRWQVIDRTSGEPVPTEYWHYERDSHTVVIERAAPFHEYTVSFLAVVMWDPTHMYNSLINDWDKSVRDIPFDVRYAASWNYMKEALRDFLEHHPSVDVVRFTTFFYHFFLVFNERGREKLVDWFGYPMAISEKAFEQFFEEYGYELTVEDLVDEGYYHSPFRLPTKPYLDFMRLVRRLVSSRAKELVCMVHASGKEAMMFLGDTWIGVEPYSEEFKQIGLDAVVGSIGNGATCRMLAEIDGVSCREGRLLPYFFPDTFCEGKEPAIEAMAVWISARRALFRRPLERIGFGGYPSLACQFERFLACAEHITQQFREIVDMIRFQAPYCGLRVGVLNAWGRLRSWQTHMVAHALPYKELEAYSGVLEALSGMAVEVSFFSFDDIRQHGIPRDVDVILNVGAAGTAFSGGTEWTDSMVAEAVRRFVYEGGGFVGIGDPTAVHHSGRFFQLADVMGVERECSFTLSYTRGTPAVTSPHFITTDCLHPMDFGSPDGYVYPVSDKTQVMEYSGGSVHLAANEYGRGRGVYLAGLPYSAQNTRLLLRALYYAARRETLLHRSFAENIYCEAHSYPTLQKTAVVNNTQIPQETVVYDPAGAAYCCSLPPSEVVWL